MRDQQSLRWQKLILLVLVLNLVCLAILVLRKPAVPVVVHEMERGMDSMPSPGPPGPAVVRTEQVAPIQPRRQEGETARSDVSSATEGAPVAGEYSQPGLPSVIPVPVPIANHRLSSSFLSNVSWKSYVVGVTGAVRLAGTPPPERDIPVGVTCGPHPKPLRTRFYVTSTNGGLANVFVWVVNPPPYVRSSQGRVTLLDQVDCQYQPYVFAMQVGDRLRVRNSDAFLHNVNTGSNAHSENRFTVAQTTPGMEFFRTIAQPELPLKILCNVHPWMIAYGGVFDHPWFAVTDTNGAFYFPVSLPPGKYQLVALHMKAGGATQEIVLTPGPHWVEVGFTLRVPAEGLTQR